METDNEDHYSNLVSHCCRAAALLSTARKKIFWTCRAPPGALKINETRSIWREHKTYTGIYN
jgi:hypothetical protein